MHEKYLSIIITCHNDGKYIKQCIENIVSQKNENTEVIFVDDASDDNSMQIAQKYKAYLKIIQFENNVGLSFSRNAALKVATGEYVMFVDGDDYIAYGTLERILELLANNECDLIMGLMEVFKDSPDVLGRWNDPVIGDSSVFKNKSVGEMLNMMCDLKLKIAPVQKYIVKKSFIEYNNLWFEDVLHEDQLWTPKMLCFANSIIFLNHKFYYHRIRKNSLGDRFDEVVCNSYFQTCRKLLTFSKEISDENKIRFLQSRCEYLLAKINTRIGDWDILRRKALININKDIIIEITNELGLYLSNLEVRK